MPPSSIRIRRSRTIYTRIVLDDYARLKALAQEEEMGITDLVRHYISVGLRTEGHAPLNLVPYNFQGRPRGPNVRRG
jgi:hypothetical protein